MGQARLALGGPSADRPPIVVRRVYEPKASEDGYRVLVDRLWPRGLSKDRAELDEWLREVAPSPTLRHWFGHQPERWEEFVRRYRLELRSDPAAVAFAHLRQLAAQGPVTLLFGARDMVHNNARALQLFLEEAADSGNGGVPAKPTQTASLTQSSSHARNSPAGHSAGLAKRKGNCPG